MIFSESFFTFADWYDNKISQNNIPQYPHPRKRWRQAVNIQKFARYKPTTNGHSVAVCSSFHPICTKERIDSPISCCQIAHHPYRAGFVIAIWPFDLWVIRNLEWLSHTSEHFSISHRLNRPKRTLSHTEVTENTEKAYAIQTGRRME